MDICIVGWYGTETLGDRAILIGILEVFAKLHPIIRLRLGSLYPAVTERTVLYDQKIYEDISQGMTLSIFDLKDKKMIEEAVRESDMVLVGGGPLMTLDEMQVLRYTFAYAKKKNKKTMLFGCGIGPIQGKFYIDQLKLLLHYSDLSVFRDENSLAAARQLCGNRADTMYCLHDPAIIPIGRFLKQAAPRRPLGVTVNFRDPPGSSYGRYTLQTEDFVRLACLLSERFGEVTLVPMHTYYTGGDDRLFLSKIQRLAGSGQIIAAQKPVHVFELFDAFYNSFACVGMRYHSVIFQSFLNGNNIILDYTGGPKGKIGSFLSLADPNGYYRNRLIGLQDDVDMSLAFIGVVEELSTGKRFFYDSNIFNKTLEQYCLLIRQHILNI